MNKHSKVKQLLTEIKSLGKDSHYSNLFKITKTSSVEMPRSQDPACRLTLKFDPTLPTAPATESDPIVKPDEKYVYKKL